MKKCRLSASKQNQLIVHFVACATARCVASLHDLDPKTVAYYFLRLRTLIAWHLIEERQEIFAGEVEADESYFGGARKGKRGRGAADKIPVFGLLQRGGKVYTQVIQDARGATLCPIIERKVMPDSIVYTDCFAAYNSLDVGAFSHMRINHSEQFAARRNHINGIENFWNQAKRHLRKFNGVPKQHFDLYLKECEWRFNNPVPKDKLFLLKQFVKGHLI